jgi:hypothetical protein
VPTSKPPGNSLKATIAALSKPVDCWLDRNKCAFVVEMAEGQRLTVWLTAEEFEEKRKAGVRVYDGERGE